MSEGRDTLQVTCWLRETERNEQQSFNWQAEKEGWRAKEERGGG